MKVAILGGSFDPPHNGHVQIAQEVIRQLGFDLVWLIPCFAHAFGKNLSSPAHRFAMTKLLENKTVKVSDYEIQKTGISISFETLQDLSKLYPQESFSWIIGSDQIGDFPKWEHWQDIITKYGLIIVERGKENHLPTLQGITFLKSDNIPNISSTEIREKVKKGEPINELVPKVIENYIKEHKLYNTSTNF